MYQELYEVLCMYSLDLLIFMKEDSVYLHLTDQETKAQMSYVTCWTVHSIEGIKRIFNSKSEWFQCPVSL